MTERWLDLTTVAQTTFKWDPIGDQLILITDPLGARWRYSYDTLGRRIQAIDPDLGTWTYTYQADGKVDTQTDARGTVTSFFYDALRRPTRQVVAPVDGAAKLITSSFYDEAATGYANVGQLTRQLNETGRVCFDYDVGGRVVRQRWTMPRTTALCTDAEDPDTTATVKTTMTRAVASSGSTIRTATGSASS